MAVQFKENSFTIEIYTGCNPVENWLQTQEEMIHLFQSIDREMAGKENFYHVLEIMRALMPDYQTARNLPIVEEK